MISFFAVKPQSSSTITKTGVLFGQFVIEYNLWASVGDHFSNLVKVMFSGQLPSFRDVRKFYCAAVIFPSDDRAINDLIVLEQPDQMR